MNKELKEQLETLVSRIKAKRKYVNSEWDLEDIEWAAIDSYNKGLTEAAEMIEDEIEKAV